MRLKSVGLIAAIAVLAAMALPNVAGAATVALQAKLKGKEEPSGGDSNGTGEAQIAVNKKKRKVCFTLFYEDIAEPVAAHIHDGDKGEDGPIVVPLEESSFPSGADGCVKDLKKSVLKAMIADPQGFYVNIHNDEFPGGAVRGHLKPASG